MRTGLQEFMVEGGRHVKFQFYDVRIGAVTVNLQDKVSADGAYEYMAQRVKTAIVDTWPDASQSEIDCILSQIYDENSYEYSASEDDPSRLFQLDREQMDVLCAAWAESKLREPEPVSK